MDEHDTHGLCFCMLPDCSRCWGEPEQAADEAPTEEFDLGGEAG
jgi:hypothetical protein